MHGGDPVEALRVDNRVATMVDRMAAGPYLQVTTASWADSCKFCSVPAES